jgi:hypothetical protein
VQVQGLAAICPECGLLVSVGQETAAQIDPVSAAETQYQPPPLPRQPDTARINRAIYWIMGSVIALVLILVGTLIVLVAMRRGGTAAPAPPPAPLAVAPAPKPRAAAEPQGPARNTARAMRPRDPRRPPLRRANAAQLNLRQRRQPPNPPPTPPRHHPPRRLRSLSPPTLTRRWQPSNQDNPIRTARGGSRTNRSAMPSNEVSPASNRNSPKPD